MIAFSFLCRTLAVLAFFLFGAPMSSAAEKGPDTPSVFSPEAPRPEACRECAGLPYYRPSAAAAASGNAASENQQKGTSGAPPRLEREGSSKRSHLSSDPRVNSARRLLKRNRFPEVLEILRPLATDHPDQTDVRFLLGLAASRGSQQSAGSRTRNASSSLNLAIACLPVHPDPPAWNFVRVRSGTGVGVFFQGGRRRWLSGPFRAGLGREAA